MEFDRNLSKQGQCSYRGCVLFQRKLSGYLPNHGWTIKR